MTKINLAIAPDYEGCYDADREQWDIYVSEQVSAQIGIKTNLSLSQDGETYWHCYLVSAKWEKKSKKYHLIYKDY